MNHKALTRSSEPPATAPAVPAPARPQWAPPASPSVVQAFAATPLRAVWADQAGTEPISIPTIGGTPLPPSVRAEHEERLNADLSTVRVFKDSEAAPQLNALAFAQGEHLHFAAGQYNATTLSHELGHVIQQREGRVPVTGSIGGVPINDDSGLEAEASAGATAPSGVGAGGGGPVVQRMIGGFPQAGVRFQKVGGGDQAQLMTLAEGRYKVPPGKGLPSELTPETVEEAGLREVEVTAGSEVATYSRVSSSALRPLDVRFKRALLPPTEPAPHTSGPASHSAAASGPSAATPGHGAAPPRPSAPSQLDEAARARVRVAFEPFLGQMADALGDIDDHLDTTKVDNSGATDFSVGPMSEFLDFAGELRSCFAEKKLSKRIEAGGKAGLAAVGAVTKLVSGGFKVANHECNNLVEAIGKSWDVLKEPWKVGEQFRDFVLKIKEGDAFDKAVKVIDLAAELGSAARTAASAGVAIATAAGTSVAGTVMPGVGAAVEALVVAKEAALAAQASRLKHQVVKLKADLQAQVALKAVKGEDADALEKRVVLATAVIERQQKRRTRHITHAVAHGFSAAGNLVTAAGGPAAPAGMAVSAAAGASVALHSGYKMIRQFRRNKAHYHEIKRRNLSDMIKAYERAGGIGVHESTFTVAGKTKTIKLDANSIGKYKQRLAELDKDAQHTTKTGLLGWLIHKTRADPNKSTEKKLESRRADADILLDMNPDHKLLKDASSDTDVEHQYFLAKAIGFGEHEWDKVLEKLAKAVDTHTNTIDPAVQAKVVEEIVKKMGE